LTLDGQGFVQVRRAPVAEGHGLLPGHTDHGVGVVGRVREVVEEVGVVVAICKVVDPTGGVRVDGHNVSVQKIPARAQGPRD